VTIFYGILYSDDSENVYLLTLVIFLFVLFMNSYFILFWIYLFLFNYSKSTNVVTMINILRVILLREKKEVNKLIRIRIETMESKKSKEVRY